jgi:tRNA dimethylallyltransferase
MSNPELIVLVGPTAVGKTAAAIEICRILRGEIISSDSMQVYRHLDIGTAKPTAEERASVPFHLIDFVEPVCQFTVSDWKQLAEAAIADVTGRGNVPIVSGGTGLYIRALLDDWKLAGTPRDPRVREALMEEAAEFGSAALHGKLAAVDPVTAGRLHPNDTVRIVRALEVYYATGIAISEYQSQDRLGAQPRAARKFGLTIPRPELYARIEQRVDAMMAAGFEQEVRGLLDQGFAADLSPMRSLGYKEMVRYIGGELTYSDMLAEVKQNTRRYAKRQQTWFNADKSIDWIDVAALSSAEVAGQIVKRLELARVTSTHD